MLQKAASAVFTFLVTNPDHEVMRENLKFYSNLPEVDMHQVVNLEARVKQLCLLSTSDCDEVCFSYYKVD